MAKIYETFRQLVDQNKSIFTLFKDVNPGLCQAVWDAREPQIEALKESAAAYDKTIGQMKEAIDKAHLVNEKLRLDIKQAHCEIEKIQALAASESEEAGSRIRDLDNGIEEARRESERLRTDNAKKDSYIKGLEFVRKSDTHQKEQLTEENERLKVMQENAAARLADHEEVVSKITASLDEKDLLIKQLSSELKKAEAYSRQYRLINNRMSTEMDKMNREVETLRSAIN